MKIHILVDRSLIGLLPAVNHGFCECHPLATPADQTALAKGLIS